MQRDQNAIPAIVYKILDAMEPRILANHVRTFADFLVDEFNTNQSEASNYINLLLNMIWDQVEILPHFESETSNVTLVIQHLMAFDQFIHVLVLRPLESSDTMIMVQLLIMKTFNRETGVETNPFLQRVQALSSFPIDHWEDEEYFRHHMKFHRAFPESFNFEILATKVAPPPTPTKNTLPVYFG